MSVTQWTFYVFRALCERLNVLYSIIESHTRAPRRWTSLQHHFKLRATISHGIQRRKI